MKYTEVTTEKRTARIAFEPQGWGEKYQRLHDQTDVSGFENWLATCHNNFSNAFAEANQDLYDGKLIEGRKGYWAVISRDIILKGGRLVGGKLEIEYLTHSGLPIERKHKVPAPQKGWVIPTMDSVYDREAGIWIPWHHDTVVPHATLPFEKKEEAVGMLADYLSKKAGMEKEYALQLAAKWIPSFWRPDTFDTDMFAGRDFRPDVDDGGRFDAALDWLPSVGGDDGVASLPAYKEPEKAGEVKYFQPVEAK